MSTAAGASFAGSEMAMCCDAEALGKSVVCVGVGGWLVAEIEGVDCGKVATGSGRLRFSEATGTGGVFREGASARAEDERTTGQAATGDDGWMRLEPGISRCVGAGV